MSELCPDVQSKLDFCSTASVAALWRTYPLVLTHSHRIGGYTTAAVEFSERVSKIDQRRLRCSVVDLIKAAPLTADRGDVDDCPQPLAIM